MEALCPEAQLQETRIRDDSPRQSPRRSNKASNPGSGQDVEDEGRRQNELKSRVELKQDNEDKRYKRMKRERCDVSTRELENVTSNVT